MATLNTLRTRFGIVLSVFIVVALFAFTFSLGAEMGFSGGNDPVVGKIDGDNVNYSDYIRHYEQVKRETGISEQTTESRDRIAQIAWSNLFNETMLLPGYEKLSLAMGDKERASVIRGTTPTQTLYSIFMDSQMGYYNFNAVNNFLSQAAADDQAAEMWNSLMNNVKIERGTEKFTTLVKAGNFTTQLQAEAASKYLGRSIYGRWVAQGYDRLTGSEYSVSNCEAKKFYNDNKLQYKRVPKRTFEYVEIPIVATADDKLEMEELARAASAEFKAASDARRFVREHTYGSVSSGYLSAEQIGQNEAATILANRFLDATIVDGSWKSAKALDIITAPDSLSLRHIVLPANQRGMADSLSRVLRGKENDFQRHAMIYSMNNETKQRGGDLGAMAFSTLPQDYIKPLQNARKGDVIVVESNGYIQLVQPYKVGRRQKLAQVASITHPLEASSATRRALHSDASKIIAMARQKGGDFQLSSNMAGLATRITTIYPSNRSVRQIDESEAMATWINNANIGDVSEVFNIGDKYYIAHLREIEEGYFTPFSEVKEDIKTMLSKRKKYDKFTKNFSATNIEEASKKLGADIKDFENIQYGLLYVQGSGIEPALVGAITSTEKEGGFSTPVEGELGIYYFTADKVNLAEPREIEPYRELIQSELEEEVNSKLFRSIWNRVHVQDFRGKFF